MNKSLLKAVHCLSRIVMLSANAKDSEDLKMATNINSRPVARMLFSFYTASHDQFKFQDFEDTTTI